MKGVQETNRGHGAFDVLDGPCCESPTCPVRELWPYDGETDEQFKARLRAKYNWPAMAREAHPS